jgi:hypothetical protein
MTVSLPKFKRGDTFALTCIYKQEGIAHDLTNITIKCQIREATILVTDLDVTKANQTTNAGVFVLTPSVGDTTTWPSGNLLCDIQFTEGGVVRSTETFFVSLIEQVTI